MACSRSLLCAEVHTPLTVHLQPLPGRIAHLQWRHHTAGGIQWQLRHSSGVARPWEQMCNLLLRDLLLQRHGRRLHGGLPPLHRRRQLLVHARVLRLHPLLLLALLLGLRELRLLLLVVWRCRLLLGVAPHGSAACNLWHRSQGGAETGCPGACSRRTVDEMIGGADLAAQVVDLRARVGEVRAQRLLCVSQAVQLPIPRVAVHLRGDMATQSPTAPLSGAPCPTRGL